jgi:hypothetical protein
MERPVGPSEEAVQPAGATEVSSPKKKRKIVLVESGDLAEQEARDVAEKTMEADKGQVGLFQRIWKHNLFRELYRQRELAQARTSIQESENIYANDEEGGASRSVHEEAMRALVERFSNDYDTTLHAGEARGALSPFPENETVRSAIKKLIGDYATGAIDQAVFKEERTRIISLLSSGDPSGERRSAMYADNLMEIAEEVKASVSHGAGLESLDLDFEIVVGRAKSAIKTEAKFNKVDWIIDKIENTRVGRLVNETTVASAVAIAYSLTAGLSQRFARSKIAAWGTFGATALISGGIAGMREKKRLEEERRQHARELAKGETFDPNRAPRRVEMEQFRHETKNATDLANSLESALFEKDSSGELVPKPLTQEEWDRAAAELAEIDSRISLSDREKIDLISYSKPQTVVQEQTRLDILRAKARIALREAAGKSRTVIEERTVPGQEFVHEIPGFLTTEEIKRFTETPEYQNETDPKKKQDLLAFWISEQRLAKNFVISDIDAAHASFTESSAREYANWDWYRAGEIQEALRGVRPAETVREERTVGGTTIPDNRSVEEYLASLREARVSNLMSGVESRDAAFKKLRNRKVAVAVTKGLVTGLVIGGVAQEVGAFFKEGQEGFIEGLVRGHHAPTGGTAHLTALESLRQWMSGEHISMVGNHETLINGQHIQLPDGVELVHNSGNNYALMRNGELMSNVDFDDTGVLTPDSQHLLEEQGVRTNIWDQQFSEAHTTNTVVEVDDTRQATVGAKDYIANHPGDTIHAAARTHLDNNTPEFDRNELKLWWGGTHGTGIDASGSYVFDVRHMTPDGSYHNGLTANAQELLKQGKLTMLLSLSRDTQLHPFEIPIQPDGTVHIDPNSEIGKIFFANNGGKAEFLGSYAEVARATRDEIIKTADVEDHVKHFQILATHPGKGIDSLLDTIPGKHEEIVPIVDEVITTEHYSAMDVPVDRKTDLPPFIPVFGRLPLEPTRRPRSENPPPYVSYPHRTPEETERLRVDMSPRLRENPSAELDIVEETTWYFKDQERRYPGYPAELQRLGEQVAEPLGENVEAVVALAVAGHQEHENIYRTLETYAVQEKEDGTSVWEGDKSKYEILIYVNWPQGADPSRCMAEIARFRQDHPEVVLRVFQQEITNGKKEVGWYKKQVFDLALSRNQSRQNQKDILIVANDADTTYSSVNYLEAVTEHMNLPANRECDAILGRQDLDPEVYDKNPTFHAVMRFWQFMEAIMRAKNDGSVGTQGRNTVLRGSSYAAIGGNREKDFWADLEFGDLLKAARGKTTIDYMNRAWVMVDPRREIDKFKKGELLGKTWHDFNNRDVRGQDAKANELPEDLDVDTLAVAREDDPQVENFRKVLEEQIQSIIDGFGQGLPQYSSTQAESGEKIIRRAAGFVGIKMTTKRMDGRLKVTIGDTSKLRRRLKEYKDTKRSQAKIKDHPLKS